MAYNFTNITPAVIGAGDSKPGYSDVVLFAPIEEFTTIASPGAYTNPGDKKRITTAHTFAAQKGFASLKAKAGRVREEGTTAVGEIGGWTPSYKYVITIKNQSPAIEEWLEEMINAEGIWLFNSPECGVNEYVQLGSSCFPARCESYTSKSGSKGEGGSRDYEVVVASPDRYWYTGAVTIKA